MTTHLNLLNIIDNYLENDFNDLCQLVLNKNIIKSSFVRPLLNYLIINEIFKQNSNEYKGMFINKKECSLGKFDDYIEEFVKQDLYDCNSEKNRFLLFSFLIDEKILEVTDRNE